MPNTKESGGQNYFIGANAAGGFVNYADEIFGPLRKVYIIKGGPGTGKSTWMKRVAAAAERAGHSVERYYCSSDSASLDGIVIPALSIGLTDGTAPHIMEAKYPGARETLIDLGAYWNETALTARYETIRILNTEKSRAFASVYQYLGIIASLHDEYEERLVTCIDGDKIDAAAERLVRKLGKGDGFAVQSRQVSAIGMNGRTYFDSYEANSSFHYRISDTRGLAPFVLDRLLWHAERLGHAVMVSRDPTGRIDAVRFIASGVSVTSFGDPITADKLINTERFVRRERLSVERSRLRFLARLEGELYTRVEGIFDEIRRCHFALEDCYAAAMDYRALEAASASFVIDVLSL